MRSRSKSQLNKMGCPRGARSGTVPLSGRIHRRLVSTIYRKRLFLLDALRGGFPSPSCDRNRAHSSQMVIGRPSISIRNPAFGFTPRRLRTHDMTNMPQFINPHPNIWAGAPQRVFVCVCHRKAKVPGASNWVYSKNGVPSWAQSGTPSLSSRDSFSTFCTSAGLLETTNVNQRQTGGIQSSVIC
jgi:hypothetical protein